MSVSDIPLSGWLHKRHAHTTRFGKRWGKRFVALNCKRGTLSVGKGARCTSQHSPSRTHCPCATMRCGLLTHTLRSAAEKGEARTILPLRDVTDVRMIVCISTDHWCEHVFEIVCPPFRLQLRASSETDCDRWVKTIREHVDDWHTPARLSQKALSSGTPVAVAIQARERIDVDEGR